MKALLAAGNNRGRVETQPRCKIQYPMKNRGEDAYKKPNRCITTELFFINTIGITINKKILHSYEKCRIIIDRKRLFFYIHHIFYQLHRP